MKKEEIHKEIQEIMVELPSIEPMTNPTTTGSIVPNQHIIYGKGFTLFQSYQSPIVMRKNGKVYLFKDWDYSKTTGKYRNEFLNETKKETLAKLQSGEYIAVDFKVLK